jgi:hypothetical protein
MNDGGGRKNPDASAVGEWLAATLITASWAAIALLSFLH